MYWGSGTAVGKIMSPPVPPTGIKSWLRHWARPLGAGGAGGAAAAPPEKKTGAPPGMFYETQKRLQNMAKRH